MNLRIIIAAFLLLCQLARAFSPDSLEVSYVNFYPGKDIYELEGHSALRVRYPDAFDVAISYGMFDFNKPNFVYRFVKGETDYSVGDIDWRNFEYQYKRDGRRIVEWPIPMDSVQKERFYLLLYNNLLPQNREYRYNYVKDNCALRPLWIIEAAMDDTITLGEPQADVANASTFREIMRYYHRNYPWYQFGIDLALGSGIDYKLTPREKAFAPVVLDAQLAQASIAGRPLSTGPIVLNEGSDATLDPTPWPLRPLPVCSAVLVLALMLTWRDMRRLKVTRWFDAALFAAFGLAGLVLTFLIFVSTHEATSPNWLYMWLNPLCLIVPIFIWLKNCKIVVMSYLIANFALLIALAIIWPLIQQSGNIAFIPLAAADVLRSFSYIYVNIKTRNKALQS